MRLKKMRVIGETATKGITVIKPDNPTAIPVFRGEGAGAGDTNFLCGKCGEMLIKEMNESQFSKICIRCPICKSYNYLE